MKEFYLMDLSDFEKYSYEDLKRFLKLRNGSKNFNEEDYKGINLLLKKLPQENRVGFHVSYYQKRLDKEFDLIRLSDECLVNIEIKARSIEEGTKQIRKNFELFKKQLEHIKEIKCFVYIYKNKTLYIYNENINNIVETSFEELNLSLKNAKNYKRISYHLEPKSLYETPEFFINNSYQLSEGQERAKIDLFKRNKKVNHIVGCAGSGKTLLAFNLYNHYKTSDRSVVYLSPTKIDKIICEKLLLEYNILTTNGLIKSISEGKMNYEIIIVDEAQRLTEKAIFALANSTCEKIIFFSDANQKIDGIIFDIDDYFFNEFQSEPIFIESSIRTDNTFEEYGRRICGLPKLKNSGSKILDKNKIEIIMMDDYIRNKSKYIDYEYIIPTKSKYLTSKCNFYCENKTCNNVENLSKIIHDIIGLEREKILVHFCHAVIFENGKLDMKHAVCYGNLANQYYTIISRAKNDVAIIVDSPCLYNYFEGKRRELQ